MSEVKASRSAVTVGIGILALGLSASIYLVLAGRAVGPSAFAGLGVQWTLVYTLGAGLFVPFEQEISRQVAHRGALDEGARPVVRRAALAAGGLCLAIIVLVVGTLPWLYDLAFFGNPALVVGLLLALVGLAGQYLMRGTFSGSGAFGCYSAQITTESAVRAVGTLVLFTAGVHSVAPYALLVGVAPLVSVAALARPFWRLASGRGSTVAWRDLTRNIAWLLAAALAAQSLANLGTIAVRVLGRDLPSSLSGYFMSGLTITRLPIFAFAVIQVTLLPSLARSLAVGRHHAFRRQLVLAVSATAGLAVAGVLGAFALGPEVLRILFGPEFALGNEKLAFMAMSTGFYMLACVLQPAVVVLGGHRATAIAWLCGLGAFLLTLATSVDVFDRVVLALVLGGVVTTIVHAAELLRLRSTGAHRTGEAQAADEVSAVRARP